MQKVHPTERKKFFRKLSPELSDSSDFSSDFSSDISSDSQKTTYDDPVCIKQENEIQVKTEESFWNSSKLTEQHNNPNTTNDCLAKIQHPQISRYKFQSIAQSYKENVIINITNNKYQSMTKNAETKNAKENQKIKQWKISIIRKMQMFHFANSSKNNNKNTELMIKKIKDPQINHNEIEPKQFSIYICHCYKTFIQKDNLRMHLLSSINLHSIRFQIDTKVQRKHQSIIYNLIGSQMKIQSFGTNWLYKSFQIMFIQAEIHYYQSNKIKNKQLFVNTLNLKNFDIKFQDSYDKELQLWFTNQWMNIYQSLHENHKGNEFLCHKCLSIEDHICLFALGLINSMIRNRKRVLVEMSQNDYSSVLQLIKVVLKDCVEKPKQKKVKIQSTDFKSISRVLNDLRDMLFRYLETFEYIDLSEFEEKQELNDDLY